MTPESKPFILDIHTHTKEFRPSNRTEDYCALMQAGVSQHLHAIAITDHNAINPKAIKEAEDGFLTTPLIVFPGVELGTVYTRPYLAISLRNKPTISFQQMVPFHMGIFGSAAQEIQDVIKHLKRAPRRMKTVLAELEGRELMITINHPMLPDKPKPEDRLGVLESIGEVDRHGVICAMEYPYSYKDQALMIARNAGWTIVGGSDAHVGKDRWAQDLGSIATKVYLTETQSREPKEILQKLRRGRSVYPVERVSDGTYAELE